MSVDLLFLEQFILLNVFFPPFQCSLLERWASFLTSSSFGGTSPGVSFGFIQVFGIAEAVGITAGKHKQQAQTKTCNQ